MHRVCLFLCLLGVAHAYNVKDHQSVLIEAEADPGDIVLMSEDQHWNYNPNDHENGPAHWLPLEVCQSTTTQQSPVMLPHHVELNEGGEYRQTPYLQVSWAKASVNALNNGHTIQLVLPAAGFSMTKGMLGDEVYKGLQAHLHTNSEHFIGTQQQVMEMHVVHSNPANTNYPLAVLGIFFQLCDGDNDILKPLVDKLSKLQNKGDTTPIADFRFDKLVNTDWQENYYWSYLGSLTTPPCSPTVVWHVLRQPICVSASQLAKFQQVPAFNIPYGNARTPFDTIRGPGATIISNLPAHVYIGFEKTQLYIGPGVKQTTHEEQSWGLEQNDKCRGVGARICTESGSCLSYDKSCDLKKTGKQCMVSTKTGDGSCFYFTNTNNGLLRAGVEVDGKPDLGALAVSATTGNVNVYLEMLAANSPELDRSVLHLTAKRPLVINGFARILDIQTGSWVGTSSLAVNSPVIDETDDTVGQVWYVDFPNGVDDNDIRIHAYNSGLVKEATKWQANKDDGYKLRINAGTSDWETFEIENSQEFGIVALKNKQSGRYAAVDATGRLHANSKDEYWFAIYAASFET